MANDESNWAVFRQDFTGNEFLVEKGLSEARARELVVEFESHKHHQHYWADQIVETTKDFEVELKAILAAGSSLENGLRVILNQGATLKDCVNLAQIVGGLSEPESKRIVATLE